MAAAKSKKNILFESSANRLKVDCIATIFGRIRACLKRIATWFIFYL
jgi:hypothetical protein